MSDPLALFPLALAAAGGHVDRFEVQQLVAAGLTLKQRSATLVRALAGGRSALLLPPSPAFLVALAASDGSGALLVCPDVSAETLAQRLEEGGVRALFTTATIAAQLVGLPVERVAQSAATETLDASLRDLTIVLLDEAPLRARVIVRDRATTVDLGSHHPLALEGDQNAPGRDEECVLECVADGGGHRSLRSYTHRELLATSRSEMARAVNDGERTVLAAEPWSNVAELSRVASALLAGGRVVTATQ